MRASWCTFVAVCVLLCCAAGVDARRHRRRKSSEDMPKSSHYVPRGARVPFGGREFDDAGAAYAAWAKDMTAWCKRVKHSDLIGSCFELERTLALGRAAIVGQFLSEKNKPKKITVAVKESVDKIEFDDFGQPIQPTSHHLMADYRTAYDNFLREHSDTPVTRSQRMCAAFCAGRENAEEASKANPPLLSDRGFVDAFFDAARSQVVSLLGKQAKFVNGDSCVDDCDAKLGVRCTAICEANQLETPAEPGKPEKNTVLNPDLITRAYEANKCNVHAEFKSVLERMEGEYPQVDCAQGAVYKDQLSDAFRAYHDTILTGVVKIAAGKDMICPLVYDKYQFLIPETSECSFPDDPPLLVTVGKMVGQGSFGFVFAATYKKGGKNVDAVIKLLRNGYMEEVAGFELAEKEDFPNTVKRVPGGSACEPISDDVFKDFLGINLCYIVMENCGSRIVERLFKAGTLDFDLYWKALNSVLTAVAAYSAKNVVHGDLKPINILAKDDGTVTVVDLGTMRIVPVDKDGVATWVQYPYTVGFCDKLSEDPTKLTIAETPIYYYDMRSTARTFCSLLFRAYEECVYPCGCDGDKKSWKYSDKNPKAALVEELVEYGDLPATIPDQATRKAVIELLADMWNTQITPADAADTAASFAGRQ